MSTARCRAASTACGTPSGELLTCPFCLGVWIGTAYVAGLGVAPRAARGWAAVFTVTGVISDFLQQAYGRVSDG